MSTTGSARVQRLLDDYIEPFLQHLRDAGYAERTLRKKRTVARAFDQWANRKGIALIDLDDSHFDAFIQRLPRAGKFRQESNLQACGCSWAIYAERPVISARLRKRRSHPQPALFSSTRITCATIAGSRRIRFAFICR